MGIEVGEYKSLSQITILLMAAWKDQLNRGVLALCVKQMVALDTYVKEMKVIRLHCL